jgi:hypothetical protein
MGKAPGGKARSGRHAGSVAPVGKGAGMNGGGMANIGTGVYGGGGPAGAGGGGGAPSAV